MANYAIFGGAGFFTGPTLGNLLTVSKLRIVISHLKIVGDGFLLSQSVAGGSREFGILFSGGTLNYIYGSADERLLLNTSETSANFGSPAKFDITFDLVANTVTLYRNDVLIKSLPLTKSSNRVDGVLFRLGARGGTDLPDTTGGFMAPSGTFIGNTDIYIDDALVRRYVMPNAGATVPESIGGNILTQRDTWPADNSEWGSYVDPQGFTVNQSSVKPGDAISGSYTGWPAAPTASLVLTDTNSNTLTLTPTITGGAGNGTWSATIPALPSVGASVDLLLFGNTTVSFGGFTAKAGPTLAVAATQTLTTLATGFDDYVFQGWTPQPVAGDQLVTNTVECYFRDDGDLVWPEMTAGIAPAWYVEKSTGTVYGIQIDVTGLVQAIYPAGGISEAGFTAIANPARITDVSSMSEVNLIGESKPLSAQTASGQSVFSASSIASPKIKVTTHGESSFDHSSSEAISLQAKSGGLSSINIEEVALVVLSASATGESGFSFSYTDVTELQSQPVDSVVLVPTAHAYSVIRRGFASITGLAQGADYIIEIPFRLDGAIVTQAYEMQFDLIHNDGVVYSASLNGGLNIQNGAARIRMPSSETIDFIGTFKFELWMKPIGNQSKKHFIDYGSIHFMKTIGRI